MKVVIVGAFATLTPRKGFRACAPSTDWILALGFNALGHPVTMIDAIGQEPKALWEKYRAALPGAGLVLVGAALPWIKPTFHGFAEAAHKEGAKLALFHGDLREKMEPDVVKFIEHTDAFFLTTGGARLKEYHAAGKSLVSAFSMNPAFVVSKSTPVLSDILFTGDVRTESIGGDRLRQAVIEDIQKYATDKKLKFLTPGFESIGVSIPRVTGQDYINHVQGARVGLGINRFINFEKYTSSRMTSYIGNGCLYVCNRNPGLDDLFKDGEHCLYFDSYDQCREAVEFGLTMTVEERSAFTKRAQEYALKEFGKSVIAQHILDITFTGDSKAWWKEICK